MLAFSPFSVLLETMSMQNLGGQTKSIMAFLKVAYCFEGKKGTNKISIRYLQWPLSSHCSSRRLNYPGKEVQSLGIRESVFDRS